MLVRFDYECPVHGVREYFHESDQAPATCDVAVSVSVITDAVLECGEPLKKLFNTFPGCEFSTIRTLSDRDPAYTAWLNSDEVKADVRAGKLRPVGKGEDIAHGGQHKGPPPLTTAEREKRDARVNDEFERRGRPTVAQTMALQERGELGT